MNLSKSMLLVYTLMLGKTSTKTSLCSCSKISKQYIIYRWVEPPRGNNSHTFAYHEKSKVTQANSLTKLEIRVNHYLRVTKKENDYVKVIFTVHPCNYKEHSFWLRIKVKRFWNGSPSSLS